MFVGVIDWCMVFFDLVVELLFNVFYGSVRQCFFVFNDFVIVVVLEFLVWQRIIWVIEMRRYGFVVSEVFCVVVQVGNSCGYCFVRVWCVDCVKDGVILVIGVIVVLVVVGKIVQCVF